MDPYAAGVLFFIVFQNIFGAGRMFIRIFMVKNFGWDDFALLVALIFADLYSCTAFAIFCIAKDRTAFEMPLSTTIPLGQLTLSCLCEYIVATGLLKVALAALLLRVLKAKWQRITIYVTLAIFSVYTIIMFFIALFECGTPSNFALKIAFAKQCLSAATIEAISYLHAILSSAADITMGVLPVIFVIQSNLSTRDKISVGCILVIGSAGCITSLIRIPWIHFLTNSTFTFYISARGITLMSSAELSIGLTCVCLATYKPLFRVLFPCASRNYYYYYPSTHSNTQTDMEQQQSNLANPAPARLSKSETGNLQWAATAPLETAARRSRIGGYRISRLMRFNYPHAAYPANAYSIGVLPSVGIAVGGSEPSLEPSSASSKSSKMEFEVVDEQTDTNHAFTGRDSNRGRGVNINNNASVLQPPPGVFADDSPASPSDSDVEGMFSAGPLVTGNWQTQHRARDHSAASSMRRNGSLGSGRNTRNSNRQSREVSQSRPRGRTNESLSASVRHGASVDPANAV